jgi:hypothetical protein
MSVWIHFKCCQFSNFDAYDVNTVNIMRKILSNNTFIDEMTGMIDNYVTHISF